MSTEIAYHPRVPLSDPSWFYGRTAEVNRLFSFLNKASPQNVSIVGQRRIGKSWLLKLLVLDEARRSKHLAEPEKYTFIYWDLQTEWKLAPEMFIPRLTELILAHLRGDLAAECRDYVGEAEPIESLMDILDLLEVDGQRIILMLDEFAAVTSNTAFGAQFFSHLRALFSRPSLTCVTSSFRSLGEMCHLGPDSPFFNIFARIQLRLLSNEEAEEMASTPFTEAGIEVEAAALRAMSRLTGPHPCFISQLGYALANDSHVQDTKQLTVDDVDRYNGRFRTEVFDDYSYYVARLRRINETNPAEGEEALAMLQHIAAGNPPDSTENRTFTRLYDLSLVRLSGGQPVPFSTAFSQFLKKNKGTDVYFEQAFANPALDGPNFVRLCEIALTAAQIVPQAVRGDLEAAVRNIQGRPQDAMRICGRDVLDPLLAQISSQGLGQRYSGNQYTVCEQLGNLAENRQFPKFLASSLHNIRIAGNDGSHQTQYSEPCTPGRAFLTVLETIHVAAEVYERYPTN